LVKLATNPTYPRSAEMPRDPYDGFKNEYLRFWLCAIRELRYAFEAAVASKWGAPLIVAIVLGGYAR
jgi:hypothetical protein